MCVCVLVWGVRRPHPNRTNQTHHRMIESILILLRNIPHTLLGFSSTLSFCWLMMIRQFCVKIRIRNGVASSTWRRGDMTWHLFASIPSANSPCVKLWRQIPDSFVDKRLERVLALDVEIRIHADKTSYMPHTSAYWMFNCFLIQLRQRQFQRQHTEYLESNLFYLLYH